MRKDNKFKVNGFTIFLVMINIMIIISRIVSGSQSSYQGNTFSIILFSVIFGSLIIAFLRKEYDDYIIIWLSFYFAAPAIKVPLTEIGSLGIINAVFIPLMIIVLFNPKSKYYLLISGLIAISVLNFADVPIRYIISSHFEVVAPLLFFYFVIKKCRDPKRIIYTSIFISLVNIPLVIYEIIVQPSWGSLVDWRGIRIFGSLFWHNSYSFYLLPHLLVLYTILRKNFSKGVFAVFIILLAADILTFSRSGLLSLMLGTLVYELLYSTGFKLTQKKIVICFLIILSIIAYVIVNPQNPHLQTSTIVERTAIWETITPLISNNIVQGNGLGSYELYRNQVLHSLSPHNYYLGIIFEIGIIGLSIVIIFLYLITRTFYKYMKEKGKEGIGELGIAMIISLLAYSIVGGAGFDQVVSLNLWVIFGCLIIYPKTEKDDGGKKQ